MRRLALLLLAGLVVLAGAGDAEAAKKKRKKRKATPPPSVLVYSGTVGFRHNSIPYGNAVLAHLSKVSRKYTVSVIEKPQELTPARLAASDIVLWNSTTGGESPFSDGQQAAYEAWIACGGGHMGIHASSDSYKDWPAWAELTGAFFKSHPITPTSAADDEDPEHEGWGEPEATILVKDRTSLLTSPWHGKESFLLRDEFYALDGDPAQKIRDFRPLLAFGGFSDPVVTATFGDDYAPEQPLSWTGSFRGLNRLFYTNLGHSTATWHRPDFQDSLLEGIAFVAGKRPSVMCLRQAGIAPPAPPKRKPPA